MSIFDYIKANQVPYKPGSLTIKDITNRVGELFHEDKRKAGYPMTLYTGLRGMYTFNYALAADSGIITKHMTKKHGRFTRLLGMGLREAVDENGIIWMIGKVKGKGYYFTNLEQRAPKRTKNIRFTSWEFHLQEGLEPLRQLWPAEYPLHYLHWKDKHDEKKEAKRTGIRRKGTTNPELWPYLHEY